jgi:RNA polymerase sigma factor (sigma-70 family)
MSTVEAIASLVERARAGDQAAFTELVRRFQAMAYGYAYSILEDFPLAEDAAQEAFVEAYRKLDDLREPAAFPGWFRRIVFKYCDRIARGRRMATVSLDALGEVRAGRPGPEEVVEQHEREDLVLQAIRSLPQGQRMATTLFYIDGYSQREVAAFLDVPLSTVKNRLYAARKRLKERMITMVGTTLKQHALPEDFAQRLLRYPFPCREPTVEIVDFPGAHLRVRCTDAQSHFVPLVQGGKCDWTFYDWPGARLTGVYECHVIASARWKEGALLREWVHFSDLEGGKEEWKEEHILVEGDTYRWVEVKRGEPGMLDVSTFRYANGEVSEPWPMTLQVGQEWGEMERARVVGVSRITVGDQAWTCLKVAMVSAQGKETGGMPTILAQWYVADSGRTVFFRRYNGPGWRERGAPGSFEALEGNIEVEYEGCRFRHWYDCIPDHALESALRRMPAGQRSFFS